MISWQALLAGTAYVCGTIIQGLVILNYPDYLPQRWHGSLLTCAVLATSCAMNISLGRHLPRFEAFMLVLFVGGFLGVLIPMTSLSTHKTAGEVFTVFQNLGGWSSTSLSFFVGYVTAINCFLGKLKK